MCKSTKNTPSTPTSKSPSGNRTGFEKRNSVTNTGKVVTTSSVLTPKVPTSNNKNK